MCDSFEYSRPKANGSLGWRLVHLISESQLAACQDSSLVQTRSARIASVHRDVIAVVVTANPP